jgi:hypothetical protein
VRRLLYFIAALCLLGTAVYAQQTWPRFHRYALVKLDATTTLDMVKDAKTGVCRLVYRTQTHDYGSAWHQAVAVTYLGEVPCDPAPVPVPVPPASPIR